MPYDVETIKIEPAAFEELSVVSRLAGMIWPDAYRKILSEGQIEYMLTMMYDQQVLEEEYRNGTRFDIIFDGEMPIGFASYGHCDDHACDCVKLHKLYLDSAYHNRGIGTLALRHVIEEVRCKGYKILHLNVNRGNTAAIRAYERNGFHKARETVTDIGNGYVMDDYVMELEL